MEYTTFVTDADHLSTMLNGYSNSLWVLDTVTALHNDRLVVVMSRYKP